MNFPAAGGGGIPEQEQAQAKAMTGFMENCFAKSAMSGVMGFGMGGLFGIFMASMAYDTPFHTPSPGAAGAAGQSSAVGVSAMQQISSLPWRQQLKVGFKDMGTRSYSMAKNFGKVGAMFAGIECGVEGLRAKNDITNGVAAGCITGGLLARNAGPQAAAGGCVAFAAFSAAIEAYLRSPGAEE